MISSLDKWKENLHSLNDTTTNSIVTLISKDDETGDKLFLFVAFKNYGETSEFSYSFILLDKNNKPKTDFMTERGEVANYLPTELKGKRLIVPLIIEMTRKLLTSFKPNNVIRKTVEPLIDDSLIRYDEITKIFVDEFEYHLISKEKTSDNKTKWIMSTNLQTEVVNNDISDNNFINLLSLLNNINFKAIYD